jgi:DNA-binding NarL/FixJ family response regulator
MRGDEGYAIGCLNAGARGHILTDSAEAGLLAATRALATGRSFFSPKVRDLLNRDQRHPPSILSAAGSYHRLTTREREILQLIAEGNRNKEIAGRLKLSVYTVETRRGNVLETLGLHGTADVILYAGRRKIRA